jgi:hypothetical protein
MGAVNQTVDEDGTPRLESRPILHLLSAWVHRGQTVMWRHGVAAGDDNGTRLTQLHGVAAGAGVCTMVPV